MPDGATAVDHRLVKHSYACVALCIIMLLKWLSIVLMRSRCADVIPAQVIQLKMQGECCWPPEGGSCSSARSPCVISKLLVADIDVVLATLRSHLVLVSAVQVRWMFAQDQLSCLMHSSPSGLLAAGCPWLLRRFEPCCCLPAVIEDLHISTANCCGHREVMREHRISTRTATVVGHRYTLPRALERQRVSSVNTSNEASQKVQAF